jgi:HEAT repeats
MSYDTWLEGILALTPFPDEAATLALREALASSPLDPRAGRLVLTPLGHGLLLEETTDWEAALQALLRVQSTLFTPQGILAAGTLRALGEDGAHLATLSIEGESVSVERHDLEDEQEEDDDVADLLEALHAKDPELRAHAIMMLGGREAPGVAPALAAVARTEKVEGLRCKALESLGSLGPSAAVVIEDVVACLRDPAPFVRYWATFALGRLGVASDGVLSELERLTSDSDDGPRYGAQDALRRLRGAPAR